MTLYEINKSLLTKCTQKFSEAIGYPITLVDEQSKNSSEKILILEYLAYLDRASFLHNHEDPELVFSAVCLLYELFHQEYPAINGYLRTILLRLNFNPSAITIQDEKDCIEGLPSFFDELKIGASLEQYRIEVNSRVYYLTEEQKNIWDSLSGSEKRVLISAPTSAGKSFLLAEYITNKYLNSESFYGLYVVPTLSLINQVHHDLKQSYRDINIYSHVMKDNQADKHIYVLTQERAANLLSSSQCPKKFDCIILDEAHNMFPDMSDILEENDVEDHMLKKNADALNERQFIYRNLPDILERVNYDKLVFAGPNIASGVKKISRILYEDKSKICSMDKSPVLKILFTFQEKRINASLMFSRKELSVFCHLKLKKKFKIQGLNSQSIENIRKNLLKNPQNGGILSLYPSPNPASTQIRKSTDNNSSKPVPSDLKELSQYLSKVLSCSEKNLCRLGFDLPNRSVIHHGKLPSHIRLCVEIAMKEGLIRSLATTSTLLQGMNFPIKYLFAKDAGNISTQKKGRQTFTIPQFKNLLGRSGRLMTDLVGYGIIIDEQKTKDDLHIDTENICDGLVDSTDNQELADLKNGDNEAAIEEASQEGRLSANSYVYQKACLLRRYVLQYSYPQCHNILKKRGLDIFEKEYRRIKEILPKEEYIKELALKQHSFFDPLDITEMISIYKEDSSLKNTEITQLQPYVKKIWKVSLNKFKKHISNYAYKEVTKYRSGSEAEAIAPYARTAQDWAEGIPWRELWKSALGYYSPENWISVDSVDKLIEHEESKKKADKDYTIKHPSEYLQDFGRKIDIISYHLPRLLKPWLDIDEYFKIQEDVSHKGSPILGSLEQGGITGIKGKQRLAKGEHRELIVDKFDNIWGNKQKDFLNGILIKN